MVAYAGGPQLAPKRLLEGPGLTEVALDGQDVWILRTEPGSAGKGTLLHTTWTAPDRDPDRPSEVAANLSRPGGLLASQRRVYWLEAEPAPAPGFPYCAPASAVASLRCREPDGQVRTLASGYPLGAIAEPPAARATAPFAPGDVVGQAGDAVYLRLRRLASTEFLRAPAGGGDLSRIAMETGSRSAVLAGGRLFWTAPSSEATTSADRVCVRTVSTSGGAPRVVTDWLTDAGTLVAVRDRLYYLGTSYALYRLPSTEGPPEFLRHAFPGPASGDGESVVYLGDDHGPQRLTERGE